MGLKGIAIGGVLGGIIGHGSPLGAILGALVGHQIEQRMTYGRRAAASRRQQGRVRDPLVSAYSVLGARPSDSNDELTRRYRELAKRHHPDAMRAKGASESEIAKATDRMSRINAAWAEVRSARGI